MIALPAEQMLDDVPQSMGMLPMYFRSIDDETLAHVWVSAVTSLIVDDGEFISAKSLSDSLCVVRERLCKKFPKTGRGYKR